MVVLLALWFLPHGWSGETPASGHAIFLLETTAGQAAERYLTAVQRLRQILEKDATIKHFNVLTYDIAGRWLAPKGWLANNAEERARAVKILDDVLLEGASDFGAALDQLARPPFAVARDLPVRAILLSDQRITWGESDVRYLCDRFQQRCGYPIRFVDEAEKGAELFKALAALRSGGKGAEGPAKALFQRFLDRVDPQVKLLAGKHGEHVQLLLKMLREEEYEGPVHAADDKLRLRADAHPAYRADLQADRIRIGVYFAEAKRRADTGDSAGAARALATAAELHAGNVNALRSVGYRLLDLKQAAAAVRLFERVQKQHPGEPHSYRDLARGLEDAGKFGLAAVQYEIIQAGTWNAKFTESLKEVALEEYAHMMRHAIRQKGISNKLLDLFGERLERIDSKKLQADLRVTISWNTDDTDVDLWVIEPDGTKCFYGHQKTKNGGELTQDVTQGYGPERYQMIKAGPGEYVIKVHYYSGPRNPQIAETHVNVVVRRNAGTPQEVSQRFTVILRNRNDEVEVCRMKY
jgi:hypothetical protein